jgi:tRNA (cmo5U34)-methyltransferase
MSAVMLAETESRGHVPGVRWAFDTSVTNCFDDMLRRSIPQYDVMRDACFQVARRYVQPNTTIVDLGCSRGDALERLVDHYGAANRFLGVEVSEPMLLAARQRFAGMIRAKVVDIRRLDLREEYPNCPASVTLSVLTLQFTPIEYRQELVRRIFQHTLPGGAVILVEKILGATAELNALMVDAYYQLKEQNGYSKEDIDRKRHSLEGVLVPVTAAWNEDLLSGAGFRHIDCFWRWMNFAGWVAVRE